MRSRLIGSIAKVFGDFALGLMAGRVAWIVVPLIGALAVFKRADL